MVEFSSDAAVGDVKCPNIFWDTIVVGPPHIIPTFFENGNVFSTKQEFHKWDSIGRFISKVVVLQCISFKLCLHCIFFFCTQVGLGIELSHEDYVTNIHKGLGKNARKSRGAL